MRSWVDSAAAIVDVLPEWVGWTVRRIEYDGNASLRINDVFAAVVDQTGPVILLDPVQAKIVTVLRERLSSRTTLLTAAVQSTDDVIAILDRAREIHESGEPQLCRHFVVALLLLRKLDQERMWAGNSKGYMWVDDIRKGRGLDEQFADAIPPLLSFLLQHELLVRKVSGRSNKYALNPDRREEIYETLRGRMFSNQQLVKLLQRDRQVVSVRALDLLDCYSKLPDRSSS
jgi:hypothetical protein